jgi:hypothetical protein
LVFERHIANERDDKAMMNMCWCDLQRSLRGGGIEVTREVVLTSFLRLRFVPQNFLSAWRLMRTAQDGDGSLTDTIDRPGTCSDVAAG